jgi:hypothetical protein
VGWLVAPGRNSALDASRSLVTIRVYRAGRLARLGHNHVIEVLDLRGGLRRLDSGGAAAELRFRPDRMRVDHPAARARSGDAFASTPDADAIAATRRNLLGKQVLDAQTWPEVSVLARVADLSAETATADLHFSVRGFGRRYQVPVVIERGGEGVTVSGTLRLRQSELGLEPFSVLGGALQVRDEIEVDFRIAGRNSGAAL